MKASLEFTLPDDRNELGQALSAPQMSLALSEIQSMFRRTIKYDVVPMTAEQLQKEFFEIIADRGIKLDD